jgi:hypothetical protein
MEMRRLPRLSYHVARKKQRKLQQLGQNRHFLSCWRALAFLPRLMRHDAQFVRINVKAQDCQRHLQS